MHMSQLGKQDADNWVDFVCRKALRSTKVTKGPLADRLDMSVFRRVADILVNDIEDWEDSRNTALTRPYIFPTKLLRNIKPIIARKANDRPFPSQDCDMTGNFAHVPASQAWIETRIAAKIAAFRDGAHKPRSKRLPRPQRSPHRISI